MEVEREAEEKERIVTQKSEEQRNEGLPSADLSSRTHPPEGSYP